MNKHSSQDLLQTLSKKSQNSDSFISSFFVDQMPYWREHRYTLTLECIHNALLKIGYTSDFIKTHLKKVSNPLQQKTLLIFELLSSAKVSERDRYLTFIRTLREALITKEYARGSQNLLKGNETRTIDELCTFLLQEIAVAFFTKVSLHDFCTSLIDDMTLAGLREIPDGHWSENKEHLHDEFILTRNALQAAPPKVKISAIKRYFQVFRAGSNLTYDPYLQENTPYVLFDVKIPQLDGSVKIVPALRLGTPTIENLFSPFLHQADISPEFRAFLQSYTISGKKHLYVNLQHRVRSFHGFTEAPRCEAIESLHYDFPNTLLTITLSKNSDFYLQEGRYHEMRSALLFKEAFKNEMFHPDKGYFFSPSFRQDAYFPFEQTIDQLLDEVHEIYFDNREDLSLLERQDFIEIFYTHFLDICLQATQVDSYNCSCKDGIDRAGGANALMYCYRLMKTEHEINLNQRKHLKTILFAPALLVKKRAITHRRFERFLSAAKRLIKHYGLKDNDQATTHSPQAGN